MKTQSRTSIQEIINLIANSERIETMLPELTINTNRKVLLSFVKNTKKADIQLSNVLLITNIKT